MLTPSELLSAADALADAAHMGQQRRHGAPYVTHPRAVAELAADLARAAGMVLPAEVAAAALLHDVVEDSAVTLAQIRDGFGDVTARQVDLLTKRDDGPAAAAGYYARIAAEGDGYTALVKVADRCHNLSELRLVPDRARLVRVLDETATLVLPSIARATHGALRTALQAALQHAADTAARAQAADAPLPRASHARVPRGLYGIVQPQAQETPAALAQRARSLVTSGLAVLQLRQKAGDDVERLAFAAEVVAVARRHAVPCLVNDRADIAHAAGAAGVHVGQTDLPPRAARALLGPLALVGVSSHTEREFVDACAEGSADHVAVGPVFLSRTKAGHAEVVGVEALAARAARARLPVVAIGGIDDVERALQCVAAGADLIAVVSAIADDRGAAITFRMSLAIAAALAVRDAARAPELRLP